MDYIRTIVSKGLLVTLNINQLGFVRNRFW